jgi:hypothetical protein
MSRVGFETTIGVFERAKTVHALDRAATVISGMCELSVDVHTIWFWIHAFLYLNCVRTATLYS